MLPLLVVISLLLRLVSSKYCCTLTTAVAVVIPVTSGFWLFPEILV